MIAMVDQIVTGKLTRFGFGGPWMRGKTRGQLPLFMIWCEDWHEGEVVYGHILFSTSDYQPKRVIQRMKGPKNV